MTRSQHTPRLSFVVASYQHERFIEATLRSILEQTFEDFEIVVVDDGSTDATEAIARRLAERDPRVRVFGQPNAGVIAARNRGMELAAGELISIVDSDDLVPPDRARLQVEALDGRPEAALVYGDAWLIDEEDRRLAAFFDIWPPVAGEFSVELFATWCFVPAVSVMFRRAAWERTGPFWGPGAVTDHLKWIELGLEGEAVCLREAKLGCWRWHGENVSQPDPETRMKLYERWHEGLAELAGKRPELAAMIGPRRLKWRYARCHFMGAFYAGLGGAWPLARRGFGRAWALDRSIVNGAAWISTLPVIRWVSGWLYPWVARRKLKVWRSRPA